MLHRRAAATAGQPAGHRPVPGHADRRPLRPRRWRGPRQGRSGTLGSGRRNVRGSRHVRRDPGERASVSHPCQGDRQPEMGGWRANAGCPRLPRGACHAPARPDRSEPTMRTWSSELGRVELGVTARHADSRPRAGRAPSCSSSSPRRGAEAATRPRRTTRGDAAGIAARPRTPPLRTRARPRRTADQQSSKSRLRPVAHGLDRDDPPIARPLRLDDLRRRRAPMTEDRAPPRRAAQEQSQEGEDRRRADQRDDRLGTVQRNHSCTHAPTAARQNAAEIRTSSAVTRRSDPSQDAFSRRRHVRYRLQVLRATATEITSSRYLASTAIPGRGSMAYCHRSCRPASRVIIGRREADESGGRCWAIGTS
jgi:hypothetical protein